MHWGFSLTNLLSSNIVATAISIFYNQYGGFMSLELAHHILGKNFISPEDITKATRIVYTDKQLSEFQATIPSQEVLEWCHDNYHMLVAGPNSCRTNDRMGKLETRWMTLRTEPIPRSSMKDWIEQQAMLTEAEEVPTAAEVVWCMMTYQVVRGIFLLPSVFVRTSSLNSDNSHIVVGCFDHNDLLVDFTLDSDRYADVRLLSARKLN